MSLHPPRWSIAALPLALLAAVVVAGPVAGSAAGVATRVPAADDSRPDPFMKHDHAEVDVRGNIAPLAAQRTAAAGLDAAVRWNRFGTPSSILPADGLLGPRRGNPTQTARRWLTSNRAVLGLSTAQVADLELVSNQVLARSAGYAVLFRQSFGDLPAAVDGLVTVGVGTDGVAYVSSSLSRTTTAPTTQGLIGVTDAWRTAARALDPELADATPGAVRELASGLGGWSAFEVPGIPQTQQVRLRALALPGAGVRAVYETNVVRVAGAESLGFTSYVDALSGQILVSHERGHDLISGLDAPTAAVPSAPASAPMAAAPTGPTPFSGVITASACGPEHPFTVPEGQVTAVAVASAAVATNDIVVSISFEGEVVVSSDTGTSPEVASYTPEGGLPAGEYTVQVCPFDAPTVPFLPPGDYAGSFATSDVDPPDAGLPEVSWDAYLSNPNLDYSPTAGGGARERVCWVRTPGRGCTTPPGPVANPAARAPWDVDPRTESPTFTTSGNAAVTAEAWTSPLTPGAFGQRPVAPDRRYDDAFEDVWNNSGCDPAQLVPGGNDINAATTTLFVGHNRMHDYSYFLGFDERNYNMQVSNFGAGGVAGDPEIGNVQAGALSGGAPSYLGRDNANQITLQDGIPGITNQYLFQPIAGAFYSPCADGSLDASIYGHEYTHAISNRMVAGPDGGLSGFQAGSMGESWSDLVAMEYLFNHSYDFGANSPWVVGAYATGNKATGIRNYALDSNPLHFGDIGYDLSGPEVHADGEVWNAMMWEVRQALVEKWDATGNDQYAYDSKVQQLDCAEGGELNRRSRGPRGPQTCPGNHRWIALMFDSFLLQQSATSMVDARDAFIAADALRFDGANRKAIWDAFAGVGLGAAAVSAGTEDTQPVPSYTSPTATEGQLRVSAVEPNGDRVFGRLYASRYEARVTPVADTMPATPMGDTVPMVPGTYRFTFRAPGFGITSFTQEIAAGATAVKTLTLARNLASSTHGAAVVRTTGTSVNHAALIDDTEGTNWGVSTLGTSVDASLPSATVNLAGRGSVVGSVRVSAMLRPAAEGDADPDAGSRFTALRQFAIEVCDDSAAGASCGAGQGFQRIFTSAANAFPGTRPRPLAPQLLLRTFDVPDRRATHVRIVVLENQCSGFSGYAGEQDNDPLNATDCKGASDRDEVAHVAELQVFN